MVILSTRRIYVMATLCLLSVVFTTVQVSAAAKCPNPKCGKTVDPAWNFCKYCGTGLKSEESTQLAREAYLLQDKGQIKEAVAKAREAVAKNARNAYAHAVLGYTLSISHLPETTEAEKELREALRLDQNIALAYVGWGNVYRRQKRNNDAEVAFKRAIEIAPNLVDAHND